MKRMGRSSRSGSVQIGFHVPARRGRGEERHDERDLFEEAHSAKDVLAAIRLGVMYEQVCFSYGFPCCSVYASPSGFPCSFRYCASDFSLRAKLLYDGRTAFLKIEEERGHCYLGALCCHCCSNCFVKRPSDDASSSP